MGPQKIDPLQNVCGFLNHLVIRNKLRILLAGLHENFRPNIVRVSDWLAKPRIKYSKCREHMHKIRQIQNQNTFLNHLAILNKHRTLSGRLNKPFPSKPFENVGLPSI